MVVFSHLGFPQDMKLAREVDGIDMLVSGHTHNRMRDAIVVNGAIVFQSGCHGSFVGRLDVEVEDRQVVSHRISSSRLMSEEKPRMRESRRGRAGPPIELGDRCRSVSAPLHRYAMLSAPMDDVLLEAIADAAGTQIAFSNGWRYGAPVAPGAVTLNDLWNIIPTNPPVSVVELTGAELHEMLEANLERTFAADPYEQMGGYVKRMRGLKMYFKAENPSNTGSIGCLRGTSRWLRRAPIALRS